MARFRVGPFGLRRAVDMLSSLLGRLYSVKDPPLQQLVSRINQGSAT